MNMQQLPYNAKLDKHYIQLSHTGNSPAISIPSEYNKFTVLLSSITGGTAKIQYSLSMENKILDDTAIWHDWSIGELTSEGGMIFNSYVAYIRVIADNNYVLEVLT